MRRTLHPPIRAVPRGRNVRGRGGPIRSSNTAIRVNFSDSSSYDSSSDDLPVIKRKSANDDDSCSSYEISYSDDHPVKKSTNTPHASTGAELLSDYDYSDSFEEGCPVVAEIYPTPIEIPQHQNKKKKSINKEKIDSVQVQTSNANTNINLSHPDPSKENYLINDQNQIKELNLSENNSNDKQTAEEIQQNPEPTQNNTNVGTNYQQNDKQSTDVIPCPINQIDESNLPCYRVVWKKSIHAKTRIQLIFNDEIILHSKEKKTKIGNCHVICSNEIIDCYSKSYKGSLKKSQNLTRFTLFAPQGEQYQTHEGEVMGLSFFDPKDIKCYGVRAFRIALPKKQPYFPSTKEMNLSKIAQKNVQSDDIKIYSSKLPELYPGPVLKLQFGNVHVVSSVKNFILEDENGNVIFMIYKSSNGMCSVRIAPPITPLIAFALSIAIITSKK